MRLLKYGAVLLFLMSLWGCSKGNDAVPAGSAIDPTTNKHQAGMAVAVAGGAHVGAYYENPSYCIQCHGETADLGGGITKVSCSTASRSGISCHAGKWPHGFGYAAFNLHGNTARSAADGFIGMAYCKNCHGSDYKGVSGVGVSCIDCHSDADGSHAPHAANWKTGANLNGLKHSRTHASNAAACAQCHLGGTFSHAPPKPAPAGTSPGCFNGTLCHNQAGHNPYTVATHQFDARADVTCGIDCHATPATANSNPSFTVQFSTTSPPSDITSMSAGCQSAGCHNQKPGLAHPYIWLPNRVSGITTTHGNNGTGIPGNVLNACGTCHNVTATGAKFGVPSCMSGAEGVPGLTPTIICHFSSPVTGTNVTAGCNSCHGGLPAGPNGASTPNTANAHLKHTALTNVTCNTCHNGLGSGTALHANGTPDILFLASQAGASAAYTAATKSCANIICHGGNLTPAWTATNVAGCTMCHISTPSSPTHTAHSNVITAITCAACHTGDGPGVTAVHPDTFVVKGFPARYNDGGAAYAAGVCSNISCHGGHPTNYVDPSGVTCLNCHTLRNPQVQYIDVFNGNNTLNAPNLHDFHFTFGLAGCTDCHGLDANKLPQFHFSGLNNGKRQFIVADTMAAGFAAGTIGGTGTDISSYSYDGVTPGVIQRGSCSTVTPGTGGCHNGETRFWFVK